MDYLVTAIMTVLLTILAISYLGGRMMRRRAMKRLTGSTVNTLAIALAIAALTLPALAADKMPNGGPDLTVLQAVAVGNALRELGDHPGPDGKTVSVPFRFEGQVVMNMATDIAAADTVQRNYQRAFGEKANKMGLNVPLKKDATDEETAARIRSKAEFDDQTDKMLNAPSGQLWVRIKQADLCIDSKPVAPCTTTNAIPPNVMAALLPIIEK